ncbi:hypothetical protein J3F83DRAFT_755715 [Trichoderma novae-zelandiae]
MFRRTPPFPVTSVCFLLLFLLSFSSFPFSSSFLFWRFACFPFPNLLKFQSHANSVPAYLHRCMSSLTMKLTGGQKQERHHSPSTRATPPLAHNPTCLLKSSQSYSDILSSAYIFPIFLCRFLRPAEMHARALGVGSDVG